MRMGEAKDTNKIGNEVVKGKAHRISGAVFIPNGKI